MAWEFAEGSGNVGTSSPRNMWETQEKSESRAPGGHTDHSSSPARTRDPESRLSPADPRGGHRTFWGRRGARVPGRDRSRRAVTGQDAWVRLRAQPLHWEPAGTEVDVGRDRGEAAPPQPVPTVPTSPRPPLCTPAALTMSRFPASPQSCLRASHSGLQPDYCATDRAPGPSETQKDRTLRAGTLRTSPGVAPPTCPGGAPDWTVHKAAPPWS